MDEKTSNSKRRAAYLGLVFVILVWGCFPLITLYFYQYYSPTIRVAFTALISGSALLLISRKKLKLINKSYFALAIPTGIAMSLADIVQKIGLQYTTPTHYAFLENLSCIVVPILLIFMVKKLPSLITIIASLLCLLSSFALTGMSGDMEGVYWYGDLLCALSGLFFGINIAATGAYGMKMHTPLYLMIQMFTEAVFSFIGSLILDATGIEKIVFNFDWKLVLANIVIILLGSTLCWLIRTSAIKYVGPTVVAVMTPFASVVTTVLSIMLGKDKISVGLILGVIFGLAAILLSGFGDRPKPSRE